MRSQEVSSKPIRLSFKQSLEQLNKRYGDSYEFEKLLGQGAFSNVYLVKDLATSDKIALKVILQITLDYKSGLLK